MCVQFSRPFHSMGVVLHTCQLPCDMSINDSSE